jgi:hypothetical protein
MKTKIGSALLLLGLVIATTPFAAPTHDADRTEYRAPRASSELMIDGIADESSWSDALWQELKYRWLGPEFSVDDFNGRFKVVWTQNRIYILVEIVDDILRDSHRHPLEQYWDDDCLEIFIDEDHSGGNHQFTHNAFAYHMSLDNQAIDIGTNKLPQSYSHHVESKWRQQGNTITWELAIDIYTDSYVDGSDQNTPITLSPGKVMGLMLAYCDNDASKLRENFIGSESVPSGPKDRGWIDAGLFGSLILVGSD